MKNHKSLRSVLRRRSAKAEAPSSLRAPPRHEGSRPQMVRLSTRQYPQLAQMRQHYSSTRTVSLKNMGDTISNLSPSRAAGVTIT